MTYALHLLIMICIYSILGLSLNLVVGYGGMLSLCHGAFYGIGAYCSTLLMMRAGWSFIPSSILAVVITAVIAWLVSVPSIRFRGDFFVLATLAFQVIGISVLNNWTGLTQGPFGIPGIPGPSLGSCQITSTLAFLALAVACMLTIGLVLFYLSVSPFGRTLEALRDDEVAAMALGKNVARLKRTAFTLAGGAAAVAGVLFATYTSYIDPSSFTLNESIFILCVVIIGGAGSWRGPVIGAILLVLLPEGLRFVHLPDAIAANSREILYGLLLVLMMRFRPQGIAGRYEFD